MKVPGSSRGSFVGRHREHRAAGQQDFRLLELIHSVELTMATGEAAI
jgi:hypothetical protein